MESLKPDWNREGEAPMFVTLGSMDSQDDPRPGRGPGDVLDARAEALDVLSDALRWRLADARWQAVEQVLVAMEAALEANDSEALMAATADLELAGPLRLIRIGATPVGSPPPKVRDRLNRLVYSIGVPAEGGGEHPRPAGEQPGPDGQGSSALPPRA